MDRRVPRITSAMLAAELRVRHGFFTRRGGVSQGLFASLNCSPFSGDDAGRIDTNRSRLCRALDGDGLFSLRQVHGDRVRTVDRHSELTAVVEGDALVTRCRGAVLGVLGADCAPLLFADASAGIVAAAHAGWQGALQGVTDAVVEAMLSLGAEQRRIQCAIGPAIQWASYEVGAEFKPRFERHSPIASAHCFRPYGDRGRLHFDLPLYIESRLRHCGIERIDRLADDTYADERQFFSYRRARHRDEADYGRQMGAICLA